MRVYQVQFEGSDFTSPPVFSTERKAKAMARRMLAQNGTQIIAKDLDGYPFGLMYSELIDGKWVNNPCVR